MPIKSVKMKISKNKNTIFFPISQGSLNPKIPRSKYVLCSPVAVTQTKVTTVGTLSDFQKIFRQSIIKDRPKNNINAGTAQSIQVVHSVYPYFLKAFHHSQFFKRYF